MDTKLRIFVISSVAPDPNQIAGALILSRWINHPSIEWKYLNIPQISKSLVWRALDRLTRTRIHPVAQWVKHLYETNRISVAIDSESFYKFCLQAIHESHPDIILSVAHGLLYKTAYRVSKKTGTPLILLAQDWWPDFMEGDPMKQAKEEREFLSICRDSSATIAVSEGMFHELGSPQNTHVLYDIPSEGKTDFNIFPKRSGQRLNVIYAGNLSSYGPMVEQAALACRASSMVQLEVYGRSPASWSEGREEEFRKEGVYRGFVPPEEFLSTAAQYDCILATMSFDPKLRRRMRTSFPSKIIESAQLGKPIVIWGPEDSSAVVWGRRTGAAMCVTNESPSTLRSELERLATDKQLQNRLATACRLVAQQDFDSRKIRRGFMKILSDVAKNKADCCNTNQEDSEDLGI